MNAFLLPLLTSAASSDSASGASSSTGGSTEKLKETLLIIVKSPVFYIVIGVIVLLIVAFYLYRRVVKPVKNAEVIILRRGEVYKTLAEHSPKYFLRPFIDRVGGVISLDEKEFHSDKLFINNGPDALYKVDYTFKYKVMGPKDFYLKQTDFEKNAASKINDKLREYADNGHALEIVKDYREHEDLLVNAISQALKDYRIYVESVKINLVQPMGR